MPMKGFRVGERGESQVVNSEKQSQGNGDREPVSSPWGIEGSCWYVKDR